MTGIDLNSIDEDDSSRPSLPSSVCLELWHACAGPLISLPRKGSSVVYLPQGHLEQLAGDVAAGDSLVADISPHVYCKVLDINLHV